MNNTLRNIQTIPVEKLQLPKLIKITQTDYEDSKKNKKKTHEPLDDILSTDFLEKYFK